MSRWDIFRNHSRSHRLETDRNHQIHRKRLDTYLLFHQEYLLVLCTYLFVMNQLEKRKEREKDKL